MKTIRISSIFSATTDVIWGKLQHLETWQYIAHPYASFIPLPGTGLVWRQGETAKLILRLFGFISLGIHTINVIEFDESTLRVYTREHNKTVPVWNHRITLKPAPGGMLYTDEVEISAGWKTPFVVLWSKMFYRHRQKRWQKLLAQGGNQKKK